MKKWVEFFKCIISHSSKKSLISPLHKCTIRNLDLFFPFFGELNSLCVLTDLSIFQEDEKKVVRSESRIAFCRLFIVWVKKVCWERKVRVELLGWFFALYTGVSPSICSVPNVKTVLKTLSITGNFVKSQYERKNTFLLALLVIFRGGTLSRVLLRPVLISI